MNIMFSFNGVVWLYIFMQLCIHAHLGNEIYPDTSYSHDNWYLKGAVVLVVDAKQLIIVVLYHGIRPDGDDEHVSTMWPRSRYTNAYLPRCPDANTPNSLYVVGSGFMLFAAELYAKSSILDHVITEAGCTETPCLRLLFSCHEMMQ